MKFIIDKEEREIFRKYGLIEFEGLFKEAQLKSLNQAITQILSKRTAKVSVPLLQDELLFQQGGDLWRENKEISKILSSADIPQIAAELTGQKPLRLGYDLFLPNSTPQKEIGEYSKFLSQNKPLQDICCIQGAVCGFIFPLEGEKEGKEVIESEEEESPLFLTNTEGNGVFFSSEVPLDFTKINSSYLMVVYVKALSVYIFKEEDPHPHGLKKQGYNFGDKLTNTLNPIVVR